MRIHASAYLTPREVHVSRLDVEGQPTIYLQGESRLIARQWADGRLVVELNTTADSMVTLSADAARQLAADILAAVDAREDVAA